jgi:hypothetical protein
MIRSIHHRLVRRLLGALLPLALLLAQSAALTHELNHLLRSAPDRALPSAGVSVADTQTHLARGLAAPESARPIAAVSDTSTGNSGRTGVPLSGSTCEACLVFAHMAGAIGMDAPDWQASLLTEAMALETPAADTPTDLPLRRGRDPPLSPDA